MADEKEKVFKAGFTSKTLLAIIFPIIVAGLLTLLGYNYYNLFPGPENEIWRSLFGMVPMGLAVVIILISIWTVIDNLMIELKITPSHLEAKKGGNVMSVNWRSLAFAPPPPNRKLVRIFTIGDGRAIFRITDVFFPNFDKVVKIIDTAKKAATRAGYDV